MLEAVVPPVHEVTQTLFNPYFPSGHIAKHIEPYAYPVIQVPKQVVVVFYPKVLLGHWLRQFPDEFA